MNFQIKQIQTPEDAKQASEFLKTLDAFEDSADWNNEERNKLSNDPYNSLQSKSHFSWLAINDNKVIGYIDLREHELLNKGYYTDWFVVHKDYRSLGLGKELLKHAEDFALNLDGRYIIVETGDIEIYARTRKFYENNGYKQVGHIPEYYYTNWGMFIYQKLL